MSSFNVKSVYLIVILIVSFSYVVYPCTTFIFRQDNWIFSGRSIRYRLIVLMESCDIMCQNPRSNL